ncbi:DUF2752 domain-containing protein [Moheibacter lacus]|uniref:DUF2752 domain-containing protein n=1 Tax=Moheibacter lacus TaxID=2745851 RepID=A0A838ZRV5_9FLAO|nr:DUF2752 domain-containing protein [Moheibacter lacus]MBA5629373.1 DUF2752 domain-containing protein [Moheibacter lacus]
MKYVKIGLIMLFGGAFLFYYYNFNPSDHSEPFLSCPSKSIFGLNCPGCGSQRLIHNLLHLNFSEAFRYNPLLFILLPFVAYISWTMVSNLFFGTKIRVKILYQNWFVYLLFGTIILYGILRNLPWYPFTLLAPPD